MESKDPAAWLANQFRLLQMHLLAFRTGSVGGLTALRVRLNRLKAAALAADDDGSYLAANDPAARLTGYQVAELERLSVWHLTPGADERAGERLWAAFLQVGEQRGTYDIRGKHEVLRGVHYHARAHVLKSVHVALLYLPDSTS